MTRYLIETSKVDARMVHHEHAFSFGDKGGLLDEYGFLRNPRRADEIGGEGVAMRCVRSMQGSS